MEETDAGAVDGVGETGVAVARGAKPMDTEGEGEIDARSG